jgi:hypothetical protein
MRPSQIANALYHIATKIENSKNPDRKLVLRDLTEVYNHIASPLQDAANAALKVLNLKADMSETVHDTGTSISLSLKDGKMFKMEIK